jgi:hypothetical protein
MNNQAPQPNQNWVPSKQNAVVPPTQVPPNQNMEAPFNQNAPSNQNAHFQNQESISSSQLEPKPLNE